MECAEHRAAPRRDWDLGQGGAGSRAALRRDVPPGAELVVVPDLAWSGQRRADGRRSLRRRAFAGAWRGLVVAGARSADALRAEAPRGRAARSVVCEAFLR